MVTMHYGGPTLLGFIQQDGVTNFGNLNKVIAVMVL